MSQNTNSNKPASELRQDLVSGDWVVMATDRNERPHHPKKCPFCYPKATHQEEPVLVFKDKTGQWLMQVIPNKFPAFKPGLDRNARHTGPFFVMDGIGFHEVVFPRRHEGNLAQFTHKEIIRLINAYQLRYLALMNKKNVKYIAIFHNHGNRAGASINHPHSQITALPIIDPDIMSSIRGSKDYFTKNKKCLYCTLIDWQLKTKKRVLYKNDDFIAFTPFVSRVPYEIRIYPLEHKPYFERITNRKKENLAKAISIATKKLFYALGDPPFNFFLHTAPCNGQDYSYYHYHFEIMPRLNIRAGFELGAEMEICSVLPKDAAKKLNNVSF